MGGISASTKALRAGKSYAARELEECLFGCPGRATAGGPGRMAGWTISTAWAARWGGGSCRPRRRGLELRHVRQVRGGQPAVVGGALQLQQAGVDALPQRAEGVEVAQTTLDAQVVGIVDGGLGAQGAPLLEVLLDVAALVLDVQAGEHAVGDDPGARTAPAWSR